MRATLWLLITLAITSPVRAAEHNWPSFRGPVASGVADGQSLPATWSVATGENIRFQLTIPGLAHSSPIVWGDKLFVTTAVSSRPDATFKRGLYGEGDASDDRSVQRWQVLCLDKKTGRMLWQRTAFEGEPREKRHVKATYANATPATDGRYVVAFFGSQGLFVYDMKGKLVWKKDLGWLDAGAYDLPSYEWGNASSPIIDQDRVIVQCDVHNGSFVQAFDLRTGKSLWKTSREELPSWSTPTVYRSGSDAELITNAPNLIRGYDPATGKELWRLGGSSKITAPTPIVADGLIVVASGRAPERPIFAIRAGARGELSPGDGVISRGVAWSRTQRGPYMPTPLAYGGRLYVLSNAGLFDCYDLATGAEVYRQRLPHKGSGFSASPVAADGRIYLSSEDGDVFVVKAGPEFELLATLPLGEPLMATPAISGGSIYFRGQSHLFAVGR